ncbi:MAG: OsmC family protein [Elusimicrobiota bacterium]|jgi:uncharacterized OsmC-like protein|nr:OsmC family protein [Elusimicrobiota bacterium]
MSKLYCTYQGDGQTELVHGLSGAKITTDLPPDNGGKGRFFSPTDLFASSLAACAITIMGKMAEARGKSLTGTTVEIDKVMASDPRRVAKIILKITFAPQVAAEDKPKYMASVHSCPVHNSLSKDIEVEFTHN